MDFPSTESHNQLRLAVISTPRSGNTWLRRLLANTYNLEQGAVHHPDELPWETLPNNYLLQIHWHRTEQFLGLLERHNFQVVALARHPLDVLISILHFAPHEPETARWLDGEGGNEAEILNVSPCSEAFLKYATRSRAAALLCVSQEWWQVPSVYHIRYEELVRDPARELKKFGESIGQPVSAGQIAEAVAANSMDASRATSVNQHFWRGRPGHWKSLLPAMEAQRIALVHAQCFHKLGYECDPDESLDAATADANWMECR